MDIIQQNRVNVMEILKFLKDIEYYKCVREIILSKLEKDENDKWCVKQLHSSGRDFIELKPIDYLNDTEKENLFFDIIEDIGYEFSPEDYKKLLKPCTLNILTELDQEGIINYSEEVYEDFSEEVISYVENLVVVDIFDRLEEENN